MKSVPVHHGIPAVLHQYVPWLHRHSKNGALSFVSHKRMVHFLVVVIMCLLFCLLGRHAPGLGTRFINNSTEDEISNAHKT